METTYYEIKDQCRSGLLKYLHKALSVLPPILDPKILDMGCGTGVPSIEMARRLGGVITAVDHDAKALKRLQEKTEAQNLTKIIQPLHAGFFEFDAAGKRYDLVLAEGILNIVGFKEGFNSLCGLLEPNGYLIIHDEVKDQESKLDIIRSHHCRMLDSIHLNENVWWSKYYQPLAEEILAIRDKDLLKMFRGDLEEIESFRTDPSPFSSVYYILERL